MLVGAYPFEDADDPGNIKKAIGVSTTNNLFYVCVIICVDAIVEIKWDANIVYAVLADWVCVCMLLSL